MSRISAAAKQETLRLLREQPPRRYGDWGTHELYSRLCDLKFVAPEIYRGRWGRSMHPDHVDLTFRAFACWLSWVNCTGPLQGPAIQGYQNPHDRRYRGKPTPCWFVLP